VTRAVEHLSELWREIRSSLQESSIPYERLFRQKVRREALQPLERLKGEESRAALELWLPWAKRWQARPAGRGNQREPYTVYQLMEQLVMEGRDPALLESRHGLPKGSARKLLEEAALDYASRLNIVLDKERCF
jgi:hypothetical protein